MRLLNAYRNGTSGGKRNISLLTTASKLGEPPAKRRFQGVAPFDLPTMVMSAIYANPSTLLRTSPDTCLGSVHIIS